MADQVSGFSDVKAGSTSVSLPVRLIDAAGVAVTGKLAANVAASYWRQGAAPVSVASLSDLATITTAWTAGGWKEADVTKVPGGYRFDWPDAAFAVSASVNWVVLAITVSGALDYEVFIPLSTSNAAGNATELANATYGLSALRTTQTTILDRLGGWAGSGVNNILGAIRSLARTDATLPSDIGGTFDASTDSLQALRDRGDAAWVTGATPPAASAIRAEMDANSTKLTAIDNKTTNLPVDPASNTQVNTRSNHTAADVAALVLVTPAQKIATDGSGRVTAGTVSDKTGYALTAGEHINIADALLKRDWTAVTGEAARSVLSALRFVRNRWYVLAGVLHVTKEDDTTDAWVAPVTGTSGADPITGIDPTS